MANPKVYSDPYAIHYFTEMHVLFRDENHMIGDYFFSNDRGWNYQNLNYSEESSPLAQGRPIPFVWGRELHTFYRNEDNTISDIWFDGQWHYQNISEKVKNAPQACGDPFPFEWGNELHVFYKSDGNEIYHIWFNYDNRTWAIENLNSVKFYVPLPKGDPFVVYYQGQLHTFYQDENDLISDIWFDGNWNYQNLHYIYEGALPYKGNLFVTTWNKNELHTFFKTESNWFQDIWFNGAWNSRSISLGSDVSIESNVRSIDYSNEMHLMMKGSDNKIWDYISPAPGRPDHRLQCLNSQCKDASLSKGDPFPFGWGNALHTFYRDTNNRISDIWYNGLWNYQVLKT